MEYVRRTWGAYLTLEREQDKCIKYLFFDVAAPLSLQMHKYRDEEWEVKSGEGIITVSEIPKDAWKRPITLKVGDKISIPRHHWHSFVATAPNTIIYEVQTGRPLESDIGRQDVNPIPEFKVKL